MMSEEVWEPEERQEWAKEVFFGDWAFKNWSISSLDLRPDVAYRTAEGLPRSLARVHRGLISESDLDLVELQQRLRTINDRVAEAIEKSESDAEACWKERRVWVPRIDEVLVADDDLAEIAIQSFDICDEVVTEPLVAALGLWLIGEWRHATTSGGSFADWAVENLLVVESEMGWFRGAAAEQRWNARASSERAKRSLDVRHEKNRARKEEAKAFFDAGSHWKSKAAAARAIADRFAIVEQVAKNWVSEFARARK